MFLIPYALCSLPLLCIIGYKSFSVVKYPSQVKILWGLISMYNFTLAKPSVVCKHQFLSSNWRRISAMLEMDLMQICCFPSSISLYVYWQSSPFMKGLIYVSGNAAASNLRC